jgi:hypothetical protein
MDILHPQEALDYLASSIRFNRPVHVVILKGGPDDISYIGYPVWLTANVDDSTGIRVVQQGDYEPVLSQIKEHGYIVQFALEIGETTKGRTNVETSAGYGRAWGIRYV